MSILNFAPRFLPSIKAAFVSYLISSSLIFGGVIVGYALAPDYARQRGLLSSLANGDGHFYEIIVSQGYHYDADQPSVVAFFPAFPLIARFLAYLTGWSPVVALVAVSNSFLLASVGLLAAYVKHRFPQAKPELCNYTLLAMLFFPTSLFFRMAYTEALFVFCVISCFYAMGRSWPPLIVAVLVGFATATRFAGLALLPPFALYLWQQSSSSRRFAARAITLLPLAVWGIAGFMLFQYLEFGEPFAFAQTQKHFHYRRSPLEDKMLALLAYEPVWSPFDFSQWTFDDRRALFRNPVLSLYIANPILFVVAAGLIGCGACKGWLTPSEILFSCLALAIPYFGTGYEMQLTGMGRFVSVVFPMYLVMGQLFSRMSRAPAAVVIAWSAFLAGMYAALFAAGGKIC